MRKILTLAFFFLSITVIHAQDEPFEVSLAGGAGIFARGNGTANADYGYLTTSLSYFYSKHYGFGGGLTYAGGFEGVDAMWELPLYFTRRSKTQYFGDKKKSGGQAHSPSDAGFSILNLLIPTGFDWKVGPTIGYFCGERNTFTKHGSSGFEISNPISLSADAELRMLYVFGRVKFSIAPVIGYMFTNNLSYAGTSGMFEGESYQGMSPHIRFRIQAGLSFSFD